MSLRERFWAEVESSVTPDPRGPETPMTLRETVVAGLWVAAMFVAFMVLAAMCA